MTEKVASVVLKVYFTAVAFMMYYFLTEAAYIGGIGVTYRHLFALLLVVSAFVYFLISPDIARGAVSVKGALVYAVPLLVVRGQKQSDDYSARHFRLPFLYELAVLRTGGGRAFVCVRGGGDMV